LPNHLFTIVARGHATDAQTNALTLFHVVEQIQGEALPFVVSELSLITVWQRTSEEADIAFEHRTKLVGPSGKEVFHLDQSFQMTKSRHRVLCVAQGIPFSELGPHRVEVQVRKAGQADWPPPSSVYTIEVDSLGGAPKPGLFAGNDS
jgi:hypothetical protein